MIVLASSVGSHSNKLFQIIHFEAFAKENNLRFINITFGDMSKIYNIQSDCLNRKLISVLNLFVKLHNDLVCNFDEELYNKCSPNFELLKVNLIFVGGWYFRVEQLTLKYKKYFKKKYSVTPDILNNYIMNDNYNVSYILNRISSSNIIIGIHIRRGDYMTWMDGKFYFDDDVYYKVINKMRSFFYSQNILIIIFSNIIINMQVSEDTIISNNEWFIDHYVMSQCNYLIGPPSTFTMWASYIGDNTKYYHMKDSNDVPDRLSCFKVCNG